MPTELLDRRVAPTAVGMINSLGSIAGFAGPYAFGFLKTLTGSFSYGLGSMTIAALIAGLLILRIPSPHRASDSQAL